MTKTITSIILAVLSLVATATFVQAQARTNSLGSVDQYNGGLFTNPPFAVHQYNDHTYVVLNFVRTHEEALADVAEYAAVNNSTVWGNNPYLTHITTLPERFSIRGWLEPFNSSIKFWHGAEDTPFEGNWFYRDGPAFYERDRPLFQNCPGQCWNGGDFAGGGPDGFTSENCMTISVADLKIRDERCGTPGPSQTYVVLEFGQTCLDYQTDGNPNLCSSGFVEKPGFESIVCDNGAQDCSQATCCVVDSDFDGDGIIDGLDNCFVVPNADQRDTNGDGYGNVCDADLDNNGIVNAVDLGLFRSVFFTPGDLDADLNGDNIVNAIDLGIFRASFFMPPGPSGLAP